MDSSQQSLKRTCDEASTSQKRVASSPSDTFGSQSGELYEWQQSAISWKRAYDQKVAQCLSCNQLPIGPVEQYLDLISSIRTTDQISESTPQTHPSVAPSLPHSSTIEVENRGRRVSPDPVGPAAPLEPTSPQNLPKTHPERLVLAPETPGILLAPETASVLLVPETPASASGFQLVQKATVRVASPKSGIATQVPDDPQTEQSPSHDAIHLVDSSPSTRGSHIDLGLGRSRSEASNRLGLHCTTSEMSFSSAATKNNTKPSRRVSKVKEVDTLDAYDKLTAKERSARFPRVQIWADFLARTAEVSPKRRKRKDFMKRCRIYYLIDLKVQLNLDDADRIRMRKLFEAGAQIQPELKAKHVTHIIVRDGTSWNACLRAINNVVDDPVERQTIKEMCLSSADKIPGEELIWVMDYKWVTSCLSYGAIPAEKYTCIRPRAAKVLKPPKPVPRQSPESPNANRAAEAADLNDSLYDEIETSISLKPNVHQSARNPKVAEKNVPGLESQLQLARLGEGTESDGSEVDELDQETHSGSSAPAIPARKNKHKMRHAAGDRSGSGTVKRNGPNEDICQKLEKIIELYGCSPHDNFRVLAFRKAVNVLRTQPKRVDDFDTLRKLEGIGPKTAQKILEIGNTSTHRRLQLATDQDVCRTLFKGIYGVGDSLARTWYMKGLRTLDDVRNRIGGIVLSPSQELGLRFFDDLQERISRSEGELLFDQINKSAVQVDPKVQLFLMGSFRRGKESCGNIDVMITRDDSDGKTYHESMLRLYKRLRKDGLITHELSAVKQVDKNNPRYSCLCAANQSGLHKQRRIDLHGVPFNQLGAALIYSTGNKIFNRSLRLKARHMGYTLTQQGLFSACPSGVHSKFSHLITPSITHEFAHSSPSKTLVASRTEEEIFKMLNVPFLSVFLSLSS